MRYQFLGGDSTILLRTWVIAYRLARMRGKKSGERIDKEFNEVLQKHEDTHKVKRFSTRKELRDYLNRREYD